MKLPIFLIAGCLFSTPLSAQPRAKVAINAVTVFLNGAELSSTAKVGLPQGESEVVFTNIAGNINQQSLTIGAGNGVVVQSAVFQNNYLGDSSLTPRARVLRDSIQLLSREGELLADKRAVIQGQLDVLKENRKVSGENVGLSVAELQKLLDVLNTRMTALLAAYRELDTKNRQFTERLALLNRQLAEEQQKTYQPGGQLLVRFYAPQAAAADVSLSYVVPNAGWRPAYDLRVEKVNDPVKLFYKANVFQNSGVAWKDVKLSLSTGNPNESAEAPVLPPWNLSFYQPPVAYGYSQANTIQLNRPQSYKREFLGNFKRSQGDNMGVVGGLADSTTLNNYTSVDNSGINTTFDIDLRYTIPSDGQQHNVAIKTYELPATYRYFAVPKLDRDAFLQAQITQWEDLNLLPATTNVFFEGSYVGQGYIDMRNVRDTMNLSLGRDKKIIIRRERDKNYHSVKTIGSNERQAFAYTISVRNTRREPVHLVVLDQLPLSNDKDIQIEDRDTPDASYDETTGAVRWTLDLKPTELRAMQLRYTVKYPRGKTIGNLN